MTRLIDADLLRKNMEFVCMGIMSGTEPYNAPLTEIDKAPTVEPNIKDNIIRCQDCEYRVKEWREDKRMKEKGYWVFGCNHFGDIMGYWGFGGHDNEFCSDAKMTTMRGEEE